MSGKRNEFEDLRIVYVERAGSLRTHEGKHNSAGLPGFAANAQLYLDAPQNQLLDRFILSSGCCLQLAIQSIRNVYSRAHNGILPYLWLNQKSLSPYSFNKYNARSSSNYILAPFGRSISSPRSDSIRYAAMAAAVAP